MNSVAFTILIVASVNLALGYAFALHLGWSPAGRRRALALARMRSSPSDPQQPADPASPSEASPNPETVLSAAAEPSGETLLCAAAHESSTGELAVPEAAGRVDTDDGEAQDAGLATPSDALPAADAMGSELPVAESRAAEDRCDADRTDLRTSQSIDKALRLTATLGDLVDQLDRIEIACRENFHDAAIEVSVQGATFSERLESELESDALDAPPYGLRLVELIDRLQQFCDLVPSMSLIDEELASNRLRLNSDLGDLRECVRLLMEECQAWAAPEFDHATVE